MSWRAIEDIPGTLLTRPPDPEWSHVETLVDPAGTIKVDADVYYMGDLRVFKAHEPIGPGGSLSWHLSLAPQEPRLVTWDEMKVARYRLLEDDLMMAIALPPRRFYLDMNPGVWHLHEARTLADG